MKPLTHVPTHIVTGFLGSGKSTLIRRLIDAKPPGERWVVIVNEFGKVGIDQALFGTSSDVKVRAIPGGCLCCQLAVVLKAALVEVLRRERPDRVIIEPSGLGHPSGLIQLLGDRDFAGVLELREVITLLDPRRLEDERCRNHETFRDQLAVADGLVVAMTDLATPAQLERLDAWLRERRPAFRWVERVRHGELAIERLVQGERSDTAVMPRSLLHVGSGSPRGNEASEAASDPASCLTPGAAIAEVGVALGYQTLGWRWHPAERFGLDQFMARLAELPSQCRVKAVIHAEQGWKTCHRVAGVDTIDASEWRRDSRLEIICPVDQRLDEDAWSIALNACRTD